MSKQTKNKKKSTVRHTRSNQRDRSKRPIVVPPDEQISQHLGELLQPAIEAHKTLFKKLGMRNRILTLSVVVAIVVTIGASFQSENSAILIL